MLRISVVTLLLLSGICSLSYSKIIEIDIITVSYDRDENGNMDLDSVCQQYKGGKLYAECRVAAKKNFNERCEMFQKKYEEDVKYKEPMNFYCNAALNYNP